MIHGTSNLWRDSTLKHIAPQRFHGRVASDFESEVFRTPVAKLVCDDKQDACRKLLLNCEASAEVLPEILEYLRREGNLMPCSHIPVSPYDAILQSPPDDASLFTGSHGVEMFEKVEAFRGCRGMWIIFVEKVEIIE